MFACVEPPTSISKKCYRISGCSWIQSCWLPKCALRSNMLALTVTMSSISVGTELLALTFCVCSLSASCFWGAVPVAGEALPASDRRCYGSPNCLPDRAGRPMGPSTPLCVLLNVLMASCKNNCAVRSGLFSCQFLRELVFVASLAFQAFGPSTLGHLSFVFFSHFFLFGRVLVVLVRVQAIRLGAIAANPSLGSGKPG